MFFAEVDLCSTTAFRRADGPFTVFFDSPIHSVLTTSQKVANTTDKSWQLSDLLVKRRQKSCAELRLLIFNPSSTLDSGPHIASETSLMDTFLT